MVGFARSPRFTTLAIGALFIYVVAILFRLPGLFFMAAGLVVAPLVSYGLAAAGLRAIRAERRVPERLWPDERVLFELRLENGATLPKCLLRVDETLPEGLEGDPDDPPGCVVPMLWAEPFVHRYPVTARRRGLYRLGGVQVTAVDSFDLFHARCTCGPGSELLVYPRVLPLGQAELQAPGSEGQLRRRKPLLEGTDFRGTREYQPGDDLRRIHWKSTARRGKPIVVEYEEPSTSDLLVVLDVGPGCDRGTGRDNTLECGITVAASVVSHELTQGNAVGLAAATSPPTLLPLTDNRQDLLEFLTTLAVLEPNSEVAFPAALEATWDQAPHGCQWLLVTGQLTTGLAGQVDSLLARGASLALAYVDPRGFPAGEPESGDLGLLQAMRQRGLRVFHIRGGDIVRGLSHPI